MIVYLYGFDNRQDPQVRGSLHSLNGKPIYVVSGGRELHSDGVLLVNASVWCDFLQLLPPGEAVTANTILWGEPNSNWVVTPVREFFPNHVDSGDWGTLNELIYEVGIQSGRRDLEVAVQILQAQRDLNKELYREAFSDSGIDEETKEQRRRDLVWSDSKFIQAKQALEIMNSPSES